MACSRLSDSGALPPFCFLRPGPGLCVVPTTRMPGADQYETRTLLQRILVQLAWRLGQEMRRRLILHETGFTRLRVFTTYFWIFGFYSHVIMPARTVSQFQEIAGNTTTTHGKGNLHQHQNQQQQLAANTVHKHLLFMFPNCLPPPP